MNAYDQNRLPTIDDFVDAISSLRAARPNPELPATDHSIRRGLRQFLTQHRDAFLAHAEDFEEREVRLAVWQRERFSGLFKH